MRAHFLRFQRLFNYAHAATLIAYGWAHTTNITYLFPTKTSKGAVYAAFVAPSRPKNESVTNGRTNQRTNRRTDTRSYRVASSRLKREKWSFQTNQSRRRLLRLTEYRTLEKCSENCDYSLNVAKNCVRLLCFTGEWIIFHNKTLIDWFERVDIAFVLVMFFTESLRSIVTVKNMWVVLICCLDLLIR